MSVSLRSAVMAPETSFRGQSCGIHLSTSMGLSSTIKLEDLISGGAFLLVMISLEVIMKPGSLFSGISLFFFVLGAAIGCLSIRWFELERSSPAIGNVDVSLFEK